MRSAARRGYTRRCLLPPAPTPPRSPALTAPAMIPSRRWFSSSVVSDNRRIAELARRGAISCALQFFDEMPERDVVSWNSIIAGLGRCCLPEQALLLYKEMVFEGVRESPPTFSSVVGVCSAARFCREGAQVHCRVISLGYGTNNFVASALVDLYMQVAMPQLALRVFDGMAEQNTAACNSILCGFGALGLIDRQLEFFYGMISMGVGANGVSFSYLLRGCCREEHLWEGRRLHCRVIKIGLAPSDVFVSNALVDFYSACGSLVDALNSFEPIPVDDVISWNSIVTVNAECDLLLEASKFFSEMLWAGKKPSVRSVVGLLNSVSRGRNLHFGVQIHTAAIKLGFDSSSTHVQAALIDMYGKSLDVRSSLSLFTQAGELSLECCNSLITSLLHCSAPTEALEVFDLMCDRGVQPDKVTFSAILRALSFSSFASLLTCGLLHCWVIKLGLETDIAVSCSLISAYSKCGAVASSQRIFRGVEEPNLICFTAIITGYARNGLGMECIDVFEAMSDRGIKPDGVTFLSVLSGCDHSGLVDEGQKVFRSMRELHGVQPDRRHFSCMVSLLGRAGLVKEAMELVEHAPATDKAAMWSSLLRSSSVHGDGEVGRRAVQALMELEPRSSAACLQAHSFYSEIIADMEMSAAAGEMARTGGRNREFGCSLIEATDGHDGSQMSENSLVSL